MKQMSYSIALLIAIIISSCQVNVIDYGNMGKITQNKTFSSPSSNEAVDLGLSVKWAPYNVGASSPLEFGNYYAWGETEIKDDYPSDNSNNGGSISFQPDNGNNNTRSYGSESIIGTKSDVAAAKWGNGWRMPSRLEVIELFQNCDVSETVVNGVVAMEFTSKINGNSIILPAAGYILDKKYCSTNDYGYYRVGDQLSGGVSYFDVNWLGKSAGLSVRPVREYSDPLTITNIQLFEDQTHCGYDSYIKDFYTYFYFKADFENNISLESDIIHGVGIVIYRDNEIFNEVEVYKDINTIETKFESTTEFLTFTYNNGMYSASTKGHWSIGTFIIKQTEYGLMKVYSQERRDLEFKYERQPSIAIDSIDYSNLITTLDEWTDVSHRGAYFSYDMIIDGSLFMHNGYEIVYNVENTGERAINKGYYNWETERYPSKEWVLPYGSGNNLVPDNYNEKFIFERDGRFNCYTSSQLKGPGTPTFDSVTVATIQFRSVIAMPENHIDTILSPILKFTYHQGSGKIEKIQNATR